jgi:hypothetical protein
MTICRLEETYKTEQDKELACKLGEAGKLRNFSLNLNVNYMLTSVRRNKKVRLF